MYDCCDFVKWAFVKYSPGCLVAEPQFKKDHKGIEIEKFIAHSPGRGALYTSIGRLSRARQDSGRESVA